MGEQTPEGGRGWKDFLRDHVLRPLPVGIVLIVVGILIGPPITSLITSDPQPVSAQLDEVTADLESGPNALLETDEADFHGSGLTSHVMVIRDTRLSGDWREGLPSSDEIRIYDEVDGELELAFGFRPDPLDTGSDGFGLPYGFVLRSVHDLDGDGRDELIGGFGRWAMQPQLFHPVVVYWAGDTGYRIKSLISERPSLDVPPSPGEFASIRITDYETRRTLTDSDRDIHVSGFPVEDFAAYARPGDEPLGGLWLIAAFLVRAQAHATPELYAAEGWPINLKGTGQPASQCTRPPGKPAVEISAAGAVPSLSEALVAAWRDRTGYC